MRFGAGYRRRLGGGQQVNVMKDEFSKLHPGIGFLYFGAVLALGVFILHPAFLGISFVGAMAYSVMLNRRRALKFNLLGLLPMLALIALINPVLNHEGATILLYVNDNPLTLESIYYGIASATMFISVLMWFSAYNAVMTSDKFVYMFGKIIPALSLVLSMALRFIPRFKAQFQVITIAQKCIGRDAGTGNVITRLRNAVRIVSILLTWALENSIETADSMRARGYGLPGRTSFSIFRFDTRDRRVLVWMAGLLVIVCTGVALRRAYVLYFPVFDALPVDGFGIITYAGYLLLCLTPVAFNIQEELRWRSLRSGI